MCEPFFTDSLYPKAKAGIRVNMYMLLYVLLLPYLEVGYCNPLPGAEKKVLRRRRSKH